MITICQECKYAPKKDRGVVKCCLECFLKGHRLFRFKYGVSSSRFILNSTGACTTGSCLYSPDQVVRRATERLTKGFGVYDLLGNNCETFAVYCQTNKRMSLQAYSWKNRAKNFYDDLTSQPFSVKNTAKTLFKLGVTYKFDTLRHDREVHQQDHDDHHHHQEEKDDDDDEDDDDERPR
ncbi:LRAT-like domain containing protein [Trema orientale]|uniref:LRAT-like domain containing protein n=1 Tax=Trema orientale TaxID=63057 RepID=A0A2P5AGP7_TREOI|nr:LRAT-like domain containing protein [Trema orientale]